VTARVAHGGTGSASAGVELRGWARELMRDKASALWLIGLAIAGAYLVVFVARLPHNITEITWDSDYSSEYVVPETIAHTGTDGHTVIASSGQWVGLWFGLLTAKLPLHRAIWNVAPTLLFMATALIVGWSVAQISTRRAALLAVLLGLVASPPAVAFFLAAGAHNTVYPCTALLGAYLIHLTRARRRRAVALALPPIAGLAIGVCLASDLLVAVTALIPLALTAILAGLTRDRRSKAIVLSALVTVAVAVPVAKLTTAIMHSLGFLTLATPEKTVPLAELPERARLLFDGLETLFNGALPPGTPDSLHSTVGIVSDVVMSAALLALLLSGLYATAKLIASGVRRRSASASPQLARSLYVVYWSISAATACGAFWLAAETGGGTDLHNSYYATVIFSVAAVIPLLLSSGSLARWLIPTGAAIFFAASLIRLTGGYLNFGGASASTAPAIVQAAEANHVTYGYGGYGEGSNLTWHSHGRVTSRPVLACSNPYGASICPFYMESVPSWYVPRPRHTFLLVDSQEPWVNALPEGLGKPLAVYTFGVISMYIYPYDIASRLGPQPD
jgi:hypothetical protein